MSVTISHSKSDSCIVFAPLGEKDRQANFLGSARLFSVLDLITIMLP